MSAMNILVCLLVSSAAFTSVDAYRMKKNTRKDVRAKEFVAKINRTEAEADSELHADKDTTSELEQRRIVPHPSLVEVARTDLDHTVGWKWTPEASVDCAGYWGSWQPCDPADSCKQRRSWRMDTPPAGNGKKCPNELDRTDTRACPRECTPTTSALEADQKITKTNIEQEVDVAEDTASELERRRSASPQSFVETTRTDLDHTVGWKWTPEASVDCAGYWGSWQPCDPADSCQQRRSWRMDTPPAGNGKKCPNVLDRTDKRACPRECAPTTSALEADQNITKTKGEPELDVVEDEASGLERRRSVAHQSFVEKARATLELTVRGKWSAEADVDCAGYWGTWQPCDPKDSCKQSRNWRMDTPPAGNGERCPEIVAQSEKRTCPRECTPE